MLGGSIAQGIDHEKAQGLGRLSQARGAFLKPGSRTEGIAGDPPFATTIKLNSKALCRSCTDLRVGQQHVIGAFGFRTLQKP